MRIISAVGDERHADESYLLKPGFRFIILESGKIFYTDGNPDEEFLYVTSSTEIALGMDKLGEGHRKILKEELGLIERMPEPDLTL